VKLKNQLLSQWLILNFDDTTHGDVVVKDHLFAVITWLSPGPNHLIGNHSSGDSSLELTRGNGLIDE
jgi:hypothetical protein